jgi:CO/xanthine dehydrogenase Mo-binding subunit
MRDEDPDQMAMTGGVGARRPRAHLEARARGTLRYTADEAIPVHADVALHRSTRPHAEIRAVDVSAALEMEGVHAVVTGAELLKALGERVFTGPAFSDQPPLAVDRVRYVGEPVAAVVATDRETARAAAALVWVDYEELEPVYDIADALRADSFVHQELRPSAVFGDLKHLAGVRDTNVNYEFHIERGSVEGLTGTTSVSGEFWAPPTHHVPMELPFTAGWLDDDCLVLLSTTQTPSYVRQAVSDLLDLPLSRVRITTRQLGGSFGSKMYDRLEPLVAALVWLLKRPVRLAVSREEAFLITTRHGAGVTSELHADAEGNLVATRADVAYDTGAYADIGPRITAKSGMVAAGPYRIANVSIRSRCVYTNKPSAGPFRGFGVPQVTWSHESLVDELAWKLGEDRYRFRRRHLLREGDLSATGTPMHAADFLGCLDVVADAIDWDAGPGVSEGPWRSGRGVAVGVKAVLTPTISNATLQLNQDGSASLMISTVEMGQGSDTIMAQIVAEVLCMDAARVRIAPVDTDVTPYDTITAGSRSTYHMGNAVRLVAEEMRGKVLGLASVQLGVPVEKLELTAVGVLALGEEQGRPVEQVLLGQFGARGTTLTTTSTFQTEWVPYDKQTGQSSKVTEFWFAGAVGVRLSVNTETGRVRLHHLAVSGDVGRAINPLMVEQQLSGAAVMGIGHALFDELVLDHGQVVNGTLLDYQLPSVYDMPERLTTHVVECAHRGGPFGAKGVGETGILGVAPAIANAIREATGARITTLPMTPERVLDAIGGME